MRHELPGGFVKDIVGYCEPLSLRAGASIAFKLSSFTPGPAQISIVRLISGDDRPHGTGLIEEVVDADLPAVDIGYQPLVQGSYAAVAGMPAVHSGTFEIYVFPTLLRATPQCIANMAGVELCVAESGFTVTGRTDLTLPTPVKTRRWYRVLMGFGGELTLHVQMIPAGPAEAPVSAHAAERGDSMLPAGDWVFAASAPGVRHFNGRLEAPVLRGGEAVLASWNFSEGIATQTIKASGPDGRDGRLYQTPTRGVCGRLWDGTHQSFHQAPEHYAAIHFHEDDLTDAGWQSSFTWCVPAELVSGQYALKVTQGDSEDYVPFFVRPQRGRRSNDLAYLVPTATYLAYANQRVQFVPGPFGDARLKHANDAFLFAHEEVGFSLYEYHRDDSGVHFSSRHRPILDLKPRTGTWGV